MLIGQENVFVIITSVPYVAFYSTSIKRLHDYNVGGERCWQSIRYTYFVTKGAKVNILILKLTIDY